MVGGMGMGCENGRGMGKGVPLGVWRMGVGDRGCQ